MQEKRIQNVLEEKQIAIDDKKLCGTDPKEKGPKGDYLLNAYVAENSLFIGHEKARDKKSEIPDIPRLLDRLEIKGATVSIDAMGIQVDIAEKILAKRGLYLLAVKEKQRGLLYEVRYVMRYSEPISVHTETEKEYARVESRIASIFPADRMEDKEVLAIWPRIRTLVRIETNTVHMSDNGREKSQTRYYISDADFPSVAYYGALASGH